MPFEACCATVGSPSKAGESSPGVGEPAYLRECRRPPPAIDCSRENLVFMQVDAISQERESTSKRAGVQLFGLTENGCSVLCRVFGFEHYLYVPACHMNVSKFREGLEQVLKKEARYSGGDVTLVTRCEEVYKKSIKYYIPGDPEVKFFKVRLAIPALVRVASRAIREGRVKVDGRSVGELQTFDATLDYTLRFMIEKDLRGCSWVELPAGKYKRMHCKDQKSLAQIEVDVNWNDIVAHKPEGEWLRTTPLRRLSFDIECSGRKGLFPQPEYDPVIQIANYVWEYGAATPVSKTIFTLKS